MGNVEIKKFVFVSGTVPSLKPDMKTVNIPDFTIDFNKNIKIG